MIVIIGASGSGKTTLQNELIQRLPQYHRIVTCTTRPKREGEEDGREYRFVSEEQFDRLEREGFFAETASYRGWRYGTPAEDMRDPNGVAVLTPAGLRAVRRLGMDPVAVYLDVDRATRLINLIRRGDDIEEAYRRSLTDVGQFDAVERESTIHIQNLGMVKTTRQVLDELLKRMDQMDLM